VCSLCDRVYGQLAEAQRLQAQRQRLRERIRSQREKVLRRLDKQEEELRSCLGADEHRLRGELLLAHLRHVPRGAAEVRLPDFADPGRTVTIPLDPRLSPSANAQAYFRRYQKARRARSLVEARLEETRSELAFLEESLRAAEQAETAADLQAVAEDLEREGYGTGVPGIGDGSPRRRSAAKRDGRAAGPAPLAFRSSDGWTILVGRSARGNDHLTMHLAAPEDWWLHAKGLPGAHVVIRTPPGPRADDAPPPATLREAALLAAHYSTARHGSHVPVDWTRRRHVWKPRGARPGFVLYRGERTVEVTPDPSRLPPRIEEGNGGG
jgi:predicted ribosome quality control (RQC) complex YloA/Tae2 family protein